MLGLISGNAGLGALAGTGAGQVDELIFNNVKKKEARTTKSTTLLAAAPALMRSGQ